MHAVSGQGLHTAAPSTVAVARSDGPVVLRAGAATASREDLRVAGTARSTTVTSRDGALRIATVEHLFAALGGLGIHRGVVVDVHGPEVPLVDGGARTFVDLLRAAGVAASEPDLVVVRTGSVEVGQSVYELAPADGVAVEVEVDFGDARIGAHARWAGDPDDFAARIAPARTFGFEREVPDLVARGLASHVAAESVVVIGDERIYAAGAAFTSDEPARHKLLDLVGDLYVHGGPPRGVVRARRPGHAAMHEAMRIALERGLLGYRTR